VELNGHFPASFQDAMILRTGFQPLRSWLISIAPSEQNGGGAMAINYGEKPV
jgi:hypothetical protein